jgi:hypothetical protein
MSMRACRSVCALLLFVAACGRQDPSAELGNVPSTALLHIHLAGPLPPQAWSFVPETLSPVDPALIQDLLDRGPLGMSLVAVDLTNLRPQLLLLSSSVSPDTMLALAARYLEFSADSAGRRQDLRSSSGRLLGSVASRRGWTCLYLGPAPESVVPRWLELTREQSLAADSALGLISDENGADVSIFIPSGLISFLQVAPVGNWIPWWSDIESGMTLAQPHAARLDLSFTGFVAVEIRLVREAYKVSRIRFELEDSGFTPGEMLSALQLALGGSLF